jgi:hypothetical protein
MTRTPKVRTSITIDPAVLERARRLAVLESKSFSSLVESCLLQHLEDVDPQETEESGGTLVRAPEIHLD